MITLANFEPKQFPKDENKQTPELKYPFIYTF